MNRALLPLLSLMASIAVAATNTVTYQSYNPTTGNFDLSQQITYQLPNPQVSGPGPYPVYVWLAGTYESYDDPLGSMFLAQMASRGFLAAAVQYPNNEAVQNCSQYTSRAQGIFDGSRSTSAVGVLCSQSGASCSAGIVTMGVSQGAELAVLAANYSPQVKAVYAISGGDDFINAGIPLSCMDKRNTKIPANRLTIVDGQADPYFGGQSNVQNVSGFTCPSGSTQCWSPDGSGAGWYIVQNSQTNSGLAGHCYFMDNSTNPYYCSGVPDPNWMPPATYDWSLRPNLDWLASFGTVRNFSPTGN